MLFKNIDDLSKVTRLKKSFEEMKFGFKKNSRYEKLRNITAGRLVMDIEESMQEFVNEIDYDLSALAKKHFGLDVPIDGGFSEGRESSSLHSLHINNLVEQEADESGMTGAAQPKVDPIFSKKLMEIALLHLDPVFNQNLVTLLLESKFKFLELTKQLTKVTGCLWDNSLRNSKTARNEMLIMHNFK